MQKEHNFLDGEIDPSGLTLHMLLVTVQQRLAGGRAVVREGSATALLSNTELNQFTIHAFILLLWM